MNRFDRLYDKLMKSLATESTESKLAAYDDPEFKSKVEAIAVKLSEELSYSIDPADFFEQLACNYAPEGGDHLEELIALDDAELENALREDMKTMMAIDKDMEEHPDEYL